MNFHVLTLFPDMIIDGLNTSITGRAIKNGCLSVEAVNIRDYANNKHMKVDDYPYGGGAGLVMQAAPVCAAYDSLVQKIGKKPRVVYMTPQGYTFNQKMAQDFAKEDDLVILCGHYEGIDERALERIVTDYVSIGDYVLTGGELPAMVVIDTVSRLVPGVLHNSESAETESFENGLLEYPQYTRPEVFEGKKFRMFFFQDTMQMLKNGDLKSQLKEQKNTDRIYMKNIAESRVVLDTLLF